MSDRVGFKPSRIKDVTGRVEEVMELFKVDEKTAREIINWAVIFAQEKFEKWQSNYIRRVMQRVKKME